MTGVSTLAIITLPRDLGMLAVLSDGRCLRKGRAPREWVVRDPHAFAFNVVHNVTRLLQGLRSERPPPRPPDVRPAAPAEVAPVAIRRPPRNRARRRESAASVPAQPVTQASPQPRPPRRYRRFLRIPYPPASHATPPAHQWARNKYTDPRREAPPPPPAAEKRQRTIRGRQSGPDVYEFMTRGWMLDENYLPVRRRYS